MSEYDLTYAMIATVNALLGMVSPVLRAVSVHLDGDTIYLYFFHDGNASFQYIEGLKVVATEVECAFPVGYKMKYTIEQLDVPQKVPELGRCVYRRKEST